MRVKLSGLLAVLLLIFSPTCVAQGINAKVTQYLASKVGVRCGGGECAHSAIEALRVAGAEFTSVDLGADSPAPGDYVWGTLMKSITVKNGKWKDSRPRVKLIPGDVIQYRDAKFVNGGSTVSTTQHTSVVATVTSAGMPTFVYEQNFNRIRTLRKNRIDITKLTTGYLQIYRPNRRISQPGQTKFTITNNMTSTQSLSLNLGATSLAPVTLEKANTLNSYQIRWVTITGTTTPVSLKLANGQSIDLVSAGGYEIYRTSTGAAGLRKLAP